MHTAELAIHENRLLEIEYWTQDEDRYSERVVEPYALINSSRAGTSPPGTAARAAAALPSGPDQRASALMERFEPREGLDPAADIGGWPRTRRIGGSRPRACRSRAEQARWAREQRTVLAELAGGEIVVEITFKSLDFLVREVLKEAGDAVVLEPADAREAVLAAAEGLIARAT